MTSGCSEHKSSGPGLSAAQIAGIVLGTLGWVLLLALGVVAVVSIIWYFVRKRKGIYHLLYIHVPCLICIIIIQ